MDGKLTYKKFITFDIYYIFMTKEDDKNDGEGDTHIAIFNGKAIRRKWFNNEWWFVATDIVSALTDSKDPNGYLKDMRRRDEGFNEGWGKLPPPLT